MTEQEQKELELFNEWWGNIYLRYTSYEQAAKEAWLERAKLNRQTPSKTLGSYARSL